MNAPSRSRRILAALVATGAPAGLYDRQLVVLALAPDGRRAGDSGVRLPFLRDRHQQRSLHVREAPRHVPGDGAGYLLVRVAGAHGTLAALQRPHVVAGHRAAGDGVAGGPQRQRFGTLAAAGPFNLQPAEFGKLALFVYLAGYLVRRQSEVRERFIGFMKPMAVLFVVAILLLAQPDLGSVVVMFVTSSGCCSWPVPGWCSSSVSSWWGERRGDPDHRGALPDAAGDLLPGPLGRSVWQRLSADPVPDGLWSGSWFGEGARQLHPEDGVPAGGPHRLRVRHSGRRAGLRWGAWRTLPILRWQ